MNEITLVLPTFVELPRKTKAAKKVSINLNIYRNQMHHELNACKQAYKQMVIDYLTKTNQVAVVFDKPVRVRFKLIKGTQRRTDKSNFFSIASKYLYDALTEIGMLPDDNDDYIHEEILEKTEYVKGEQYVVFTLTEIT